MAVTTKKRASLGNITNQNNELFLKSNQIFDVFASANCSNKSAKLKLAQPTQPSSVKPSISKVTSLPYEQTKLHSPSKSDAASVSIDKTMSSCDSYKSPQVEYIDNEQVSAVVSIERKALSNLYITPSSETTFNCCRRDVLSDMENKDKTKKRPATDFMERVKKDVNSTMRGILVDWPVETEASAAWCGVYNDSSVLDMESAVLNDLKFEMLAPTTKCFLRRFVRAAHGVHEAPLMQLECMASYIAELSLLEYTMLSHPPSLVAASAIFLLKPELQHYMQYRAMELRGCVKDLQRLSSNAHVFTLPAYKFVAKKFCPSIIPQELFSNKFEGLSVGGWENLDQRLISSDYSGTMYPIKARNGSVFEPNKAPSVGLTLGLLDRLFGLWNSGCSENSMKIQTNRNFRTAMVGSGQVLLDSDKTVELVG
ncbi:BnaC08g05160D [Brassica napus]|uniref:BnaC08g05160D protein n=2 Tax=Brassica TaxID=3705 RepID=A0A078HD79_BRANA|nr:BnaC08g05160D [Brassica napus]